MDTKRARQASLLALLQRNQGRLVSRAVITNSIEGYEGSDEAIRKRLQRDLEELEEGCDLVVEYVSAGPRPGYRIRRRPLALDLDAQDLATLSFVASTLGPEDRTLLHVEALGASPDASAGVIAPLHPHPALALLLQAIEERREVRFSYAKPGDPAPIERRVHPWLLIHRGGWYLIGHCLTRGAERRFKLSRIVDGPTLGDPVGFQIPSAIAGIAEPWAIGADHRARIAVDPSQVRAIARRLNAAVEEGDPSADDRVALAFDYVDDEALAAFLSGFGQAVEVLDPPSLREAIVARLDRIIAAAEAAT